MFFGITFLLFILPITRINFACAIEPYYWRLYNGTIPEDAVSTEVENLFVGRVGVCINDDHTISYYTATVNSTKKSATFAAYDKKRLTYNKNTIMILCTSEPDRLKWENVTTKTLQGDFINKLVLASADEGFERYIGKVFHENVWKISSVYQYGHEWAGFQLWNNNKELKTTTDNFQILIYTDDSVKNENVRFDDLNNVITPLIPKINTTAIDLIPDVTNIKLNVPGIEMDEHVDCLMAVIVTKLSIRTQLNLNLFPLEDQKILKDIQAPQNHMSWIAWKDHIGKNEPFTITIGDDVGSNRLLFEKTEYNITIYIKATDKNKKTNDFLWWKVTKTLENDICLPCDTGFF